LKPRKKNN